ncbi:aldehyde dehydrogenase (NAD+) [Yoonia maricola]|uniref:Aldehyde dehydrogenase n=1 Tax=Yoonia maricola TaxID=420999 RepID=A0A2M8WKC2_9RHOB|nr:aldehyde dehydrogenase family protein [Yoonia maricola]PJI91379.1 aldehyde dehydrogenase (NAD+) [Yoonia maricola]
MTHSQPSIAQVFAAQHDTVAARRTTFDYTARRAALDQLRTMVLAHEQAVCEAIGADFGKHPDEVRLTEILPLLLEIGHTRRHLRKWMRPSRAPSGLVFLGTTTQVHLTPKGTALVIAPWNFPFFLALGPAVSALAAGCSVILKPSELTPATSALLKRIVSETFAPELFTVVEGGVDAATELLTLPFGHIFFTGSPEVGQIVMTAAAKTFASVTLELGGKSPVIVGPDADIANAARWIAWGRCINGGQTCVAPDHVYVHESVKAAFADALSAQITKMYGADPMQSPDLAQMAYPRQWARVAGLIDDSKAKGATVLTGGDMDQAARKIAPTILLDVHDDMGVQQEEIFGPVLPVMTYRDLDQVIDKINDGSHPLALYVFESNAFADEVIIKTTSGTVGVNMSVMGASHPTAPFGGVGRSGNGGAHGYAGFAAFSHMRQVLRARFFPFHIVFPPYTGLTRRLIAVFHWYVRR